MITDKAIKIILCIVLIQSTIAAVLSYYENNRLRNVIKQDTKVMDSLSSDLFVQAVQLQRYELMMESIDSTCLERIDSVMADIE